MSRKKKNYRSVLIETISFIILVIILPINGRAFETPWQLSLESFKAIDKLGYFIIINAIYSNQFSQKYSIFDYQKTGIIEGSSSSDSTSRAEELEFDGEPDKYPSYLTNLFIDNKNCVFTPNNTLTTLTVFMLYDQDSTEEPMEVDEYDPITPTGVGTGAWGGLGAGAGTGTGAGAWGGLGAGAGTGTGTGAWGGLGAGAGTGTGTGTGTGAWGGLGAGAGTGTGAGAWGGLGAGAGTGTGAGAWGGLGANVGTGAWGGLGANVGTGAGAGNWAGSGAGAGTGAVPRVGPASSSSHDMSTVVARQTTFPLGWRMAGVNQQLNVDAEFMANIGFYYMDDRQFEIDFYNDTDRNPDDRRRALAIQLREITLPPDVGSMGLDNTHILAENNLCFYTQGTQSLLYMARRNDRLATFNQWPNDAELPSADVLANNGFYRPETESSYNQHDLVCCYGCGHYLHSWVPDDIPAQQHAQYYHGCPIVLNTLSLADYAICISTTMVSSRQTAQNETFKSANRILRYEGYTDSDINKAYLDTNIAQIPSLCPLQDIPIEYTYQLRNAIKKIQREENIAKKEHEKASSSVASTSSTSKDSCGVCLDKPNNIQLTACSHRWCANCIKTIINNKQEENKKNNSNEKPKCPNCRKEITDFTYF